MSRTHVPGFESKELRVIKEVVPSFHFLKTFLFHQLLVLFAWSCGAHTTISHSFFIVVFQSQILD